jgi:hypothetical protein
MSFMFSIHLCTDSRVVVVWLKIKSLRCRVLCSRPILLSDRVSRGLELALNEGRHPNVNI